MIVGVSTESGLLGLLIVIIIVIVVACRRGCNKSKEEGIACNDNGAGAVELNEDDRYYSTIPAAESNNNASAYCSPAPAEPDENKEYRTLGAPEPTNNSSPYYLSMRCDYMY